MFNEILHKLRESDDLSQTRFAREIGFSQAAVSAWENNTREPGIEALLKIARYFNVSVDYLVGNTVKDQKKEKLVPSLKPDEQKLLETYRKLDTYNRLRVATYADLRLEEQGTPGTAARKK